MAMKPNQDPSLEAPGESHPGTPGPPDIGVDWVRGKPTKSYSLLLKFWSLHASRAPRQLLIQESILEQVFDPIFLLPGAKALVLPTGQLGEGKSLTGESDEKELQWSSAPPIQMSLRKGTPQPSAVSIEKQSSVPPGERASTDAGKKSQAPDSGEPQPDRRQTLRRSQPQEKSCTNSEGHSTASEKQKKTSSEASPSISHLVQSSSSSAPCRSSSSGGPCHLAKLLNSLDQKNHKNLVQKKRPPEVNCPIRKKTRTLYRSDQLEKLESLFQEDHYPDGDKRREISQAVGVTPQRIMVWFQNRRAKWRKGENLTGAENKESSAELGPSTTSSHSSSVAELPATVPADPEPRTFPQKALVNPVDVHPEPPLLLTSDQMLAPPQQREDAPVAVVTPPLFSPPPVHRANLPFPQAPLPLSQTLSLLLDAAGSDSGHNDGLCGSWGASLMPPPTYSYLEALEPQDYPPNNQLGPLELLPVPQNQLFPPLQFPSSCLHPFSFPMPATLMPPLQEEPLVTEQQGSGGYTAQGYFPGSSTGQLLQQTPTGNLGALPWSDPGLPELSYPGPFCPPVLGQPLSGESCFQELFQAPLPPGLSKQPSQGFNQLSEEARLETTPLLSKVPEEWPGTLWEKPLVLEEGLDDKRSRGP
ncbi:homeobox protein NOBOX [Suncus etruscus]|uniref:homeobox protein NOBOX n=1 Tax=Suncus etruscus TaxID=109475 RepID=UPI00210FEF9E|nr:homeobox protein NOBOX [Suncus etruscus]